MTAPETSLSPRTEHAASWVIAAGAAIGAALSAAEPTGWAVSDLVWRCGFALVVVIATSKAQRWTWLVLAGVTATAAQGGPQLALSLLALAVAFLAVVFERRTQAFAPVIGAVIGALTIQVLLRLPQVDPTGATALIAAAATAPVLISGYFGCAEPVRRGVRWAVGGMAVFALLSAVGLAVAAFSARSDLVAGINQAQNGFDAARDGEGAVAARRLSRSASSFGSAHDALMAPWALPARVVPVLGQQAAAVQTVTDEGATLAASAASAATDADVDQLRFDDGAIDLDLVQSFEQPLEQAATALEAAANRVDAIQSPWLISPLASRLDRFDNEVNDALPDARLAIEGVRLAPALLGGDTPRHYLLAFLTPSENRSLGGFIGSFGELTATDGDLELTRSGSIGELQNAARANDATITGPPDFLARYGAYDLANYFGDVGLSPDMPMAGQVMSELYPQSGGQPVDGVITVDPVALQALLNFTGPITLDGYPEPLTADNAADVLLRQQYLTFDDQPDRKDFLEEATRKTFEALTSGDLPGPRQLADVLGPIVDQGRLMVYADNPDEQSFLEQVGLDGAFPRPRGGDLIGLTTNNAHANKIDIFMERSIDYRAEFDPSTGAVDATATIEITNNAPASGLPDYILSGGFPEQVARGEDVPLGINGFNLSFYSPLQLDDAVARSALGEGPQAMEEAEEFGMSVYSARFAVPAGQTLTLELHLSGFINPSETYRLAVANQPTVNPDTVSVEITPRSGYTPEPSGGFTVDGNVATKSVPTTDGDQRLRLRLSPP